MTASDAYALRCAMLHEGRVDIVEQRARVALSRFHFIEPIPGSYIHNNRAGDTLQLQVDVYCRQICDAVRAWERDARGRAEIEQRGGELLDIIDVQRRGLRI